MEIIKIIIDFLFNYLSFTRITIIIVAFLLVFFLELKLLSVVDNTILIYFIRIMMIVVLYYICYLMKFNFEIKINLIIAYITFTVVLIISNYNQSIKKDIIIKQKSIFKTEEQKNKYTYGTIEEKIFILKNLGLLKKQIYQKLKNNTDFRKLIKNGNEKFELMFNKEINKNTTNKI